VDLNVSSHSETSKIMMRGRRNRSIFGRRGREKKPRESGDRPKKKVRARKQRQIEGEELLCGHDRWGRKKNLARKGRPPPKRKKSTAADEEVCTF